MPKLKLTLPVVEKFIAAGKEAEVRDTQAPGLMLRVRASGRWSWSYRRTHARTDYRREFGSDWSLEQARGLARRLAIESDRRYPAVLVDEDAWLDWIGRERAERDGVKFVPPPQAPEPETGTTWRDAQAAWIVEVSRVFRDETAASYDRALRVAELRKFHDRRVGRITPEDVAEAIASVATRGVERQAETSAIAVKLMWRWMGELAQRRKYGVAEGVMEKLRAPRRSKKKAAETTQRAKVPAGADVGRVVAWLWTSTAPERDRLAALLTVYSVQRRSMVAKARVEEFVDVDGVACWAIPPVHRKTADMRTRRGVEVGSHVLPLTPRMREIVARAKEIAGESEWLFPAGKARRAGMAVAHMPASTITHLLAEVPGRPASPHDMRRAFATTYAEFARLKPSDAKVVLDHSEGVQSGDVTAGHYSFNPRLWEKAPLLEGWCAWVDAQATA